MLGSRVRRQFTAVLAFAALSVLTPSAAAQENAFDVWGEYGCDWCQPCFDPQFCGTDQPGWCHDDITTDGCLDIYKEFPHVYFDPHRGDNWALNATLERPGGNDPDCCSRWHPFVDIPFRSFAGISWSPPVDVLDPTNDAYKGFIISEYRKKSLALVITAKTAMPDATRGYLDVYLNSGENPELDEPIKRFELESGPIPGSGWTKELVCHTNLDGEGIASSDGIDFIFLRAGGDLEITVSKVYYGDYEFFTLQGVIYPGDTEPWAVQNGWFSFFPVLPHRGVYPVATNVWQPDYCEYQATEFPPQPYEYSITGIPAGSYTVTAGIPSHAPDATVIEFGQSPVVTHDFSATAKAWCRPLKSIRRPHASIPTIIKKTKTHPSEKIIIELQTIPFGFQNVWAHLESEFVDDSHGALEITSYAWGKHIKNGTKPGFRIEAQLPAGAEIPEDLYDLVVGWTSGGQQHTDRTYNSVKVVNDDYYHGEEGYYFIHVSDIHMSPTNEDREMLTAVLDDWDLINPAFILATGDQYEGSRSWATNAVAWLDTVRDSHVPIFVATGNHEEGCGRNQPHALGYRRFVRDGWERYHGQSLYAFAYDNHHYLTANDTLTQEEAGDDRTCFDPAHGQTYIHSDDRDWANNYINANNAEADFFCAFSHIYKESHRFDGHNPPEGCELCFLDEDGVAPDKTRYICPPQTEYLCSWNELDLFGGYHNVVDLKLAGHTHKSSYWPTTNDDPDHLTSAVIVAFHGSFRYGIHYIKNDLIDKKYDFDPMRYFGGCENPEIPGVLLGGPPKTDLLSYLDWSEPHPGKKTTTITNWNLWRFPHAKLRCVIDRTDGTEVFTVTTDGDTYLSHEDYFFDHLGQTVVDVYLDIPAATLDGTGFHSSPTGVFVTWH